MKRSAIVILLLTLGVNRVLSQERPDIDIQDFIENVFQTPDEEVNYDDLYESLYQLYVNPINLNNTDKDALSNLYQLNNSQINNLLDYIKQNTPLLSIYELQVVNGFSQETIESILPFVEVRSPGDQASRGNLIHRMVNERNSFFLLRAETVLESQNGYQRTDSSGYLGSPHKIYGRFRTSHSKDFSFGLTFEKDAGEQVKWNLPNKQYGLDYYSIHLFLEDKGKFKRIAVGDYQMQFGQGLVLGSGFNPGKGAETITTVKRGNTGIRPYSSVLESGFMRGAAFTYAIHKNLDISPFYSRLNQDGAIKIGDEIDEFGEYISGIQNIGLHRTYSELDSRNEILEQSYGFNVTYNQSQSDNFQGGITFINTDYSTVISKTPNNYNQFEFKGDQNYNLGLFANYNWQNFLFFGELARSKSGGNAYVAGLMSSLSPLISMSLSIRDYDRDYHSFYGNSFGEGSRNINEKGIYWGVKIEPSRKMTFSAYYDRFKFPWLRFRAEAPSEGYEYLLRASYKPHKKAVFYIQVREQSKEITVSKAGQNIKNLVPGVKRNLVGNLDLSINKVIGIKSRVQYSTYDEANESSNGMAIIQDLNLTFNKIKISTRFALFDTEDAQNRQYVYEKDLLYAFSIPAYSGQGIRNYILIQYKPTRKLTLWAKYGQYNFNNIEILGSGLNEIEGNKKSELKFQLRFSF